MSNSCANRANSGRFVRLELTGQRFGRLTVVGPAENIGTRTAWHCRCDCGREITVKTCYLRNGHITSCGCARRELGGPTYAEGTCVELLAVKTVRRNNTSGVPGVDWRASKGRWRAAICFQGRRLYLGSYQRFEDAVAARRAAEKQYHDNFVSKFIASKNEGEAEN